MSDQLNFYINYEFLWRTSSANIILFPIYLPIYWRKTNLLYSNKCSTFLPLLFHKQKTRCTVIVLQKVKRNTLNNKVAEWTLILIASSSSVHSYTLAQIWGIFTCLLNNMVGPATFEESAPKSLFVRASYYS